MSLQKLRKQRTGYLLGLSNIEKWVKDWCVEKPSEDLDEEDVLGRLSMLEESKIKLSEVCVKITEALEETEEDKDDYAVEVTIADRIVAATIALRKLLRLLRKRTHVKEEVVQHQEAVNSMTELQLKLPALPIPHFTGKSIDWLEFKDQFLNITSRTSADSQKMELLKIALKDGDAESMVKGIVSTNLTFSSAWKALEDRYDNLWLLIEQHLLAIFNTEPVQKEDALKLRALVDQFNHQLNVLQKLGQPTKDWSVILAFMMEQRIDNESKRAWRTKAGIKATPKFDDLASFLLERCSILESIAPSSNESPPTASARKATFGSKSLGLPLVDPLPARVCKLCKQSHTLFQCPSFRDLSVQDRNKLVAEKRLCYNCLSDAHFLNRCSSQSNCKVNGCNKRHNTLLHSEATDIATTTSATTTVIPAVRKQEESHGKIQKVLLSTALVTIIDKRGRQHPVRAFIDGGSMSSYITKELAEKLGVKCLHTRVPVQGLGGTLMKDVTSVTNVMIQSLQNSFRLDINCLVIDKILEQLPTEEIDVTHWQLETVHVKLADPLFFCPDRVDMLLGNDVLTQILKDGGHVIRLGDGLPTMIETELGYLVGGKYTQPLSLSLALTHDNIEPLVCAAVQNSLEAQLRQFWEIEDMEDGNRTLTPEQLKAEEHFEANTEIVDGRFRVRLPFKNGIPRLGESRTSAIRNFFHLERRLSKNEPLKQQYVAFMNEMLELGHMRAVNPYAAVPKEVNYIPHHPVVKEESLTTKVRVVLNASKKTTNGRALNDELMVGPTVQPDLVDILVRFRCKPVALVADATKMYRQIQIHPDDRRFQRIIWRESPESPLEEFELCTVIYGTSSAAYQATKCIQKMAEISASDYPEAAETAISDTYVDDVASGAGGVHEAIALRKQLQTMFGLFGFELRKWNSNRPEVIQSVEQDPDCQQIPLITAGETFTKILGMRWDTTIDTLKYDAIECERLDTKRAVLATIAKLYDPLGLMSPFVIKAKILLQRIWKDGHDWDDLLPDHLLKEWREFCAEIPAMTTVNFPRCVAEAGQVYELAVCVDASEAAYSAAAYVICIEETGTRTSNLLMAKTRAAPVKKVTLPRLELMAAVLGARLIRHLKRSLKLELSEINLYTDSRIVLAWLNGDQNRWKTFVANRTAVILSTLPAANCHHIRSEENPADLPTRGMSPQEIEQSDLWKHGTSWFCFAVKPEATVTQLNLEEQQVVSSEAKPSLVVSAAALSADAEGIFRGLIERCRSFQKMINTLVRLHRSPELFKRSRIFELESPSASEYKRAHDRIVLAVQRSSFPAEMAALKEGKPIAQSSPLISLTPKLDSDGMLRVGGRIDASQLSYSARHPLILPGSHRLTDLIVLAEHKRHQHCGPQQLLALVRQQYWPLKAKSIVRKIYRNCMQCFKAEPRLNDQLMGDLPADRCQFSPPFTVTGVDLSGPYSTCEAKGRGKTTHLSYVAHFVCFSTKAVHLERVSELSTDAFMAALERFVNRRGLPQKIWSDNGTNFVGSRNELRRVQAVVNGQQVQERVRKEYSAAGLEWSMIPARSPSVGGLWEAAVRAAKRIMNRVLTSHRLTFDEFDTFLTTVEATLNSRPLLEEHGDPGDIMLTPAHFLLLRPLLPLPRNVDRESKISLFRRWQLVVRLQEDFKQAWTSFYLQKLVQRNKWKVTRENFAADEVVLLVEEDQRSYRWRRGRIIEVIPGKDGLVRMVKLRCVHPGGGTTYETTRAVNKICKLPDVNLVGGMLATSNDIVADEVGRNDSCLEQIGDSLIL